MSLEQARELFEQIAAARKALARVEWEALGNKKIATALAYAREAREECLEICSLLEKV